MKLYKIILNLDNIVFLNICLVATLVGFLSSCSATGPRFQSIPLPAAPDNFSVIYIFRPDRFCLSGRRPDFFVDEANIVSLQNRAYVRVLVSPGKHVIHTDGLFDVPWIAESLSIDAEAGQNYFIKYSISCELLIFYKSSLVLLPQTQGIAEISETRLQESFPESHGNDQ